MISAVRTKLAAFDVHLASASPRRQEILTHVGLCFIATPSLFEENLDKSLIPHPWDYVVENARQKALDVMKRLNKSLEVNARPLFVIGCDTVVVCDGEILEKPLTHDRAYDMLSRLNKRTHEVYSGVALLRSDVREGEKALTTFYELTEVEFGDNPTEVIKSYAYSPEPLDKAGGYGIQDLGSTLVSRINGCYFNVVGFPLYRFCQEVCTWIDKY